MTQLEHIEAIEKRLWKAADTLRANSSYASNEYFLYVGVALEEEDEDFDFEETLREIHLELEDLNAEAITLAAVIKKNFKGLGV